MANWKRKKKQEKLSFKKLHKKWDNSIYSAYLTCRQGSRCEIRLVLIKKQTRLLSWFCLHTLWAVSTCSSAAGVDFDKVLTEQYNDNTASIQNPVDPCLVLDPGWWRQEVCMKGTEVMGKSVLVVEKNLEWSIPTRHQINLSWLYCFKWYIYTWGNRYYITEFTCMPVKWAFPLFPSLWLPWLSLQHWAVNTKVKELSVQATMTNSFTHKRLFYMYSFCC